MKSFIPSIFLCLLFFISSAQVAVFKQRIDQNLEQSRMTLYALNDSIWQWSESTFHEYKSTQLLKNTLKNHGFSIEDSIALILRAFQFSALGRLPV